MYCIDDGDIEELPLTITIVLTLVQQIGQKCDLQDLGSQLGLTHQDIDEMERKRHSLEQLFNMCLRSGLQDWEHLMALLKGYAIEQDREEAVAQETGRCDEDSQLTTPAITSDIRIHTPPSVASDIHSLRCLPIEEGMLFMPPFLISLAKGTVVVLCICYTSCYIPNLYVENKVS